MIKLKKNEALANEDSFSLFISNPTDHQWSFVQSVQFQVGSDVKVHFTAQSIKARA